MHNLIVCALLGLTQNFQSPQFPEFPQAPAPAVAPLAQELAAPSDNASILATGLQLEPEPAPRRPGWYGEVFGGLGSLSDGGFDTVSGGTIIQGDASYEDGFLSGFAVGYDIDENWSLELDYTYRSNDIDRATTAGGGTIGTGGDYASVAILANAIYRFRPGARLRPYVGVGLGILQEIDADFEDQNIEASERGTLAYQFLLGASYDYSGPWSVFAEARYMATEGPELEFTGGSDVYEADYDHLGLLLGARYRF